MGYLDTNNFYFILFYFSDFTLLYFSFLWKDDEEGMWQGSHITDYMMWCHKPRIWWKDPEDDVRAPGVHMVALSRTWDKNEDEVLQESELGYIFYVNVQIKNQV